MKLKAEKLRFQLWRQRLPSLLAALVLLHCSGNKYVADLQAEKLPAETTFHHPSQVTAGNESNFAPDLSPNGAYVVYTSDRKGNKDIWEKRASGGFARPLTFHSADDFSPVISPNGKAIAFVSRREDAAGDIHVLRFGLTLSAVLGASEGDIDVISSKTTEDTNPSWYPGSDKIVFSARQPGEKIPTIMVADLKDMKPQPLGEAKGDQPSVSPDGKKVAFVRGGAIFVYDSDRDVVTQVTDGGTLQDGQPRFTQDGKSLVFVRYADDTNHDGKLDGDDRPTAWRLELASHGKEKIRENFQIEPLTAAAFGAFSPQIRAPYLYVALQTQEGLDIFRLPDTGQITPANDLDGVHKQFDQRADSYEKVFVLRRAEANFARQGQAESAAETALLELDWLVQDGRRTEAEWLHAKMAANFAAQKGLMALSDLAIVQLDLAPLLYPRFKQEPTDQQAHTFEKLEARVEAILSEATGKDSMTKRILGRGLLVKAKILASSRRFFDAAAMLTRVKTSFTDDPSLTAEAAFYAAWIAPATNDLESSLRALRDVVAAYPNDRNIVRLASTEAVDMLKGQKDYVEALVGLRGMAKGLPALPALAHTRIADFYVSQEKKAVAANELRQIVDSYPESPAITIDAAERLVPLEERAGRADAADAMIANLVDRMKKERVEHQLRLRTIQIEFWLRRGETYLKENDPKVADKEYRKVIALEPWNVRAHRGLIDVAARDQGDNLDVLIDAYERGSDDDPGSAGKRYIYGYALTYRIDRAKSVSARLSAIDDAIVQVEAARMIDAQIIEIHQTLGWLYLQKGFWTAKYQESGAVLASAQKRLGIVKDFFGVGDPNWLELAIDAFQTGYFLSKEGTLDRGGLAQNLGQTYYELKNYQKSLNYYMQRIQMLPTMPARDQKTEGVLWRRAGRAAYMTDELELAETLQKNALSVWEKVSDDDEIAYSIDALALTLRERGSFQPAADLYERLRILNQRLKHDDNLIGTYSNLGYCAFSQNKYLESLDYFEKAESLILAKKSAGGGEVDPPASDDGAKKIDLSGQSSQAKGFDLFARQNLIVSFRAKIFEKLERPDLVLAALETKLGMLKEHRSVLMDAGRGKQTLAEEIAIVENNIGALRLAGGFHASAKSSFAAARESAQFLRAEDQKYLTPGEAVNAINAARIDLRLAGLGILPQKELDAAAMDMDWVANQLRPIFAEGAKNQGPPLQESLALSASLRTLGPGAIDDAKLKATLEESLGLAKKIGLDPTSTGADAGGAAGAMFAYMTRYEGRESNEDLAAEVADFKESVVNDPEPAIEWKILASKGAWEKAFEAVDRFVNGGGALASPADRALARRVFEEMMASSAMASPEHTAQALRRYILLHGSDLVLRSMPVETKVTIPADKEKDGADALPRQETVYVMPRPLQKLLSLKADKDISAALTSDEAILTVHRMESGEVLATLQGRGGVKSSRIQVSPDKRLAPESYRSLFTSAFGESFPSPGGRLYLVPSGDLYDVPWESIEISGGKVGELYDVAFLPAADVFPVLFAGRGLAKGGLGHLPWRGSDAAIRAANPMRDYEQIPLEGPTNAATRFGNYNLVQVDSPVLLNDVEPGLNVILTAEKPSATSFVNDVTMKQIVAADLTNTTALVLANVQPVNREFAMTSEGHDGWVLLSLSIAASGVATSVVIMHPFEQPLAPDADAETAEKAAKASAVAERKLPVADWAKFYGSLEGHSVAEAVRLARIPGRVFGYAGVPSKEEAAFAKSALERATKDAADAAEDNDLVSQASALKRVYYYNTLLKNEDDADEAMTSLVETLYKRRDYGAALHFKLRLATKLKPADTSAGAKKSDKDPVEYAKAVIDAAVLAVRALKSDDAARLLDEAEQILVVKKDVPLLGKVYQYRGINLENQKKYDATISAYKQSRDYYLQANPQQAAQRLLDIGTVYRNDLSNYPLALEYYDQAAAEFKKLNIQESYQSVSIDRANTLMAIGQLELAITSLEKEVLPALDPVKQRPVWVRAAQILANAYFRAGVYQAARDLNDRIVVEIEKLDTPASKIERKADAMNLRAMILAKLGQYKEAFQDFRAAIALATEYKLKGSVALLYNNYGFWAREYGDVDQSIEFFNTALKLDQELKAESSIAYDQRNLGLSIILKGDFNQARELLESALKISEQLNLVYNSAYCYFGLGDMALREKRWAHASGFFGKALELSEKGYMQDFVWRAHAGIAAALAKKDDVEGAVAELTAAVSTIEQLRAGLKSDDSRNAFISDAGVQQVYESLVVMLMRQNKAEAAWLVSERARGRAFVDSLGTQKIKFARTEEARLMTEERNLKAAIETADRKLGGGGQVGAEAAKLKDELEAATQRYADLIIKMRALDSQLDQFVKVDTVSKEELARLLPSETALVEYAVTAEALYIWVIQGGHVTGATVPVTEAELTTRVRDFRTLMQNFSSADYLGKELSTMLLEPVRAALATAKRLAIVPHQNLHFLPFAALPFAGGALIDHFPVYYLDSATMARFTHGAASSPLKPDAKIVAMANPGIRESSLPFAGKEGDVIGRYFPRRELFEGDAATKSKLLAEASSADVLHIASHADFKPAAAGESALHLTSGDGVESNLSVNEIFGMTTRASMVTLSACESGLGKLSSGDEIIGMNRAFLFAGASTVVTGLWRISDVATAVVMKRFYRYLSEGHDKAEAMRMAQQVVRRYYPHPAYWAGFRVVGDYR